MARQKEPREIEIIDLNPKNKNQKNKNSKKNNSNNNENRAKGSRSKEPQPIQPKEKNGSKNREFAVITYGFLALFIALSVYFCYFMEFQSEDFINNSYNARIAQLSNSIIRGDIVSSDGEVLATSSVDSQGNETREYPNGSTFAHVIGYNSNGLMGVELDANFYLLRSHSFILNRLLNDLKDEKSQGDTVVTTLNAQLQKTAYFAMGNYDGAVVAMEPSTGKILSMISKPDFDPNTIEDDYSEIATDSSSSVLLNRATSGLYPPGSTFKILTALEYLNEGGNNTDSFDCDGSFTSDGYEIHCYGNKAHGNETFLEAFGNSCNVVFSQVGLTLDLNSFYGLSEQLLFNKSLPTRLSNVKSSSFSLSEDASDSLIMQTSIGQGDTLVTPLHMAMIASSICNEGLLMEPYIIDSVQNDEGTNVESYSESEYGNILTTVQAEELEEYMRFVVTDGTASALNTDSYEAFGKTGSAEYNSDKDDTHSWFVGYAKDGDKEIAVAIILEGAGSGSSYAVPVAKAMFDTYFGN
ncbi:MAG: penicillin-binding protein 2 [Lachnospiraceae bacterium]|nr:penicillin-binding protein 2 [Lachnospiraceae bacterium]